ncbi:MAG TPA: outer membrane protein assembly factor BamE [Allosphingosinicella sp.]|jgi:outer membrane protein assembly factor BamE (lipoprotein component of BamABCDE complex)
MIARRSSAAPFILGAIVVGAFALGGCSALRIHQGYVMETTLANAIQPGTDNKESVMNTLGRPTFSGTFDQNDWYYVSRDTRNMGYSQPHAIDQTILHVHFDQAGNVASIDRRGLEQVASIHPSKDKTPTLGNHRSLFDELFGNIGAVGTAGKGAPTTDNPNPQ